MTSANISGMARQFIVGVDAKDALPALKKVRKDGVAFTVDLLGEAVVSEQEAGEYFERYMDLFKIMSADQRKWKALGGGNGDLDWGHSPKINISIKPSALYSQMDPKSMALSIAKAKERLRPIFREAISTGSFVLLDMEHTTLKNLTLALYKSLLDEEGFKSYPYTGIVIQAYLKDSEQDLQDLIQWAKEKGQRITIRLVKGAYWDAEVILAKQKNWAIPVFTNKYETDANFEKLSSLLLENHQYVSYACASHNIRSIAYVMERAKELGVPEEYLEYQVLYGMAEPVRTALRKAGLKLRLYAPVGEMIPGMAYLVRRLLENTANESFLRQSFAKGTSKEYLLRNPLELLAENPTPESPAATAPEYGDKDVFRNLSIYDWTIEQTRREFTGALQGLRAKLGAQVPLYIGGHEVKTGREIVSTNPNKPTEVIGSVSSAGQAEAEQAITAARIAFPAWRDIEPRQRAEYLFRAAEVARQRRAQLAALQVLEVGKNWSEADADVAEADQARQPSGPGGNLRSGTERA
ncbi:MAG: bifunctional proline dehydrogenase/L-glutamate gamma-semialdehyde dehydrogenase [Desulfotomaculaceae bacterium]